MILIPNKSLITESNPEQTIIITSLEQSIWHELEANIELSLRRLHIDQLFEPTMLLLHQLVTNATKALHYTVFKRIVDADFCINTIDNDEALEALYKDELAEHGDRNIAKFCEENGLRIILIFPNEGDSIVSISIPKICKNVVCVNKKLVHALEYQLYEHKVATDSTYCVSTLVRHKAKYNPDNVTTDSTYCESTLVRHKAKHNPDNLPKLFTQKHELKSFQGICSKLGYGAISFSSIGTILSASPSILASLSLETSVSSIHVLAKSIPKHFYNDVIWSLALQEPNGAFENYRLRVKLRKDADSSMLFNVSGYRDDDSIIHTLWQTVSFDGSEKNVFTEGSILNEARIHNITRNYVPQLVEEKAREIVRLGGNKLINEECFLAVLFCDIVGFTAYVEKNENEESVIYTLNSILRRISQSVKVHGGLIDKFMGDCVMVLFRDPHNAVIAAHEMQSHSIDINSMREQAGQDVLRIRIGIHWGKVVIGNVGTPERLDWTTIGDVVNTASRIEKNCQPGSVLISQSMCNEIMTAGHVDLKYGDKFFLKVRGKREELAVCYAYPA